MKRKYFNWMVNAKGFSVKTIKAIEMAIWKYEDFTKDGDFRDFNEKVAEQFKKYLATNKNHQTGEPLSLTSQYHTLRHINAFFMWLSAQAGYKSKISTDAVQYLRLPKKESRIATEAKPQEYPTLEYIKKLCESIEPDSDIDLRDRALIAFTALSGMRDLAIVSLPIGCFNIKTLEVEQSPKRGVKTKFSKQILTRLFEFDETLLKYVTDWYSYLLEEKLYKLTNPLFPRTEVGHASKDDYGFIAKGIEPEFWSDAGAMRKIFKDRAKDAGLEYFSPHKFRHFAINRAYEFIETAEQMKAVSQNVGHENIGTTFGYGHIAPQKASQVVGAIDFTGKKKQAKPESEELKEIKEMLKNLQKQ